MMFKEQAEKCRRQASEFAGRPEAPFLLRIASAFDELAIDAGPAASAADRHRVNATRSAVSA